ncbi:MAG: hypothetical protein N4A71_05670 [Carboxylicivirga sp.]|jgi:hypothetical protein|nr:hypothetical protein [Carboxylicivirga sp.]
MNIKQTASHLQRSGQPFDVIISTNGVESVLYSNLEPTDVEGLLNEVIESRNPEAIIIQEKKRNGSTNLKQGKFPVTLEGLAPSQPVTPMQTPVQSVPSDFKDYVIDDLKEKNGKLETRVNKLETENEQLKKDNFELEKENKYKDKEFELTQKEKDAERTNGLAGIIETVSTNPALATVAATAIGRLMGMDMTGLAPGLDGSDPAPAQPQPTGGSSTQQQVLNYLQQWFAKLDDETLTQFFQLTAYITQDVSIIPQLIDIVKPDENEAA